VKRFDAAYPGLFKCNLHRTLDHANVSAHLAGLVPIPAFRDAFNLDWIKRGYYSMRAFSPTRIVPRGPELAGTARRGWDLGGRQIELQMVVERASRLARRPPRESFANWSPWT
jgi:hypothetical protein